MRIVAVAALVALALVGPASAQVGTQLIVTMNLAGPVKLTRGSYYIAFTIDDSILTGPQSDSSNWTHYVLYRQGRFSFGRVPPAPFRPFGFEAIKPPTPYPYGEVSPDRKRPTARLAPGSRKTPCVPFSTTWSASRAPSPVELFERGEPVDLITATDRLRDKG